MQTMNKAIELAEKEARLYEKSNNSEYSGLAQCFHMFEASKYSKEVFSLMRESDLSENDYLDEFFDTGVKHQKK
jgi:hypothetical protein